VYPIVKTSNKVIMENPGGKLGLFSTEAVGSLTEWDLIAVAMILIV